MSEINENVAIAELLLISDEQIVEKHIELAVKLAGRHIDPRAVNVDFSGRFCTWPLHVDVPDYTSIDNFGSCLWFIAAYLWRSRETITAIHAMGCNLQLNFSGIPLSKPWSISACTLKWLGDLDMKIEMRA